MALPGDIQAIVGGYHGAPFRVLGPHLADGGGRPRLEIRAFLPEAREAFVATNDLVLPMQRLDAEGFFEAVLEREEAIPYRLRLADDSGATIEIEDPYRFHAPWLTDFEIHLHGEGNYHQSYEKLGAHRREVDGVAGVQFAVWAPNAQRVSVVGDFNRWDGRRHPMRQREGGIWELFLPGLGAGAIYKYEVKSRYRGYVQQKADPYAFTAEAPPKSASRVADIDCYQWRDEEWMRRRAETDPLPRPMTIYEAHLGSWHAPRLSYRELADKLVPYAVEMGYTHLELLPVMEHPFDGSWGYQVTGYFAPTARHGEPAEFMEFVDRCHQAGIGVLLDWVPGHFPRDAHGLAYFDGTALYEHEDPRKGEHRDWGTLIFNYGRNEVRNFLLSNALFWLRKYHIDGLRVDAVASMLYLDYSREPGEWEPNQYGGRENLEAIDFLRRFNELAHKEAGAVTVAEESTAWPGVSRPVYLGGLGFTFKWNMGWMHDMLLYFSLDPIHRQFHQNDITFSMLYAFTENFVLPISHDEVTHGKRALLAKMPGDMWQQFANARAFLGYMYGHPGKKLLFMGSEIGQWNEWNHAAGVEWDLLKYDTHRSLRRYVADWNRLYRQERSLWEVDFEWKGFEWIDFHDAQHSIIAFIRRASDAEDFLVFVCNFTPVVREGYRIGVPAPGRYREILNSDAEIYGGSNVGNGGGVDAEAEPSHGRDHSILVTLPPLAVVVFKRQSPGGA
ncbi:MAG TPA: 1,4-alpha-glucan branching protein GlgB [Bryobacterales bacterium]|nr:1,4-alpha-glucan branching protein GlgB [Bryobacterales bacterium]